MTVNTLRIILLIDEDLEPPAHYEEVDEEHFDRVKTEYDVRVELENYGHTVLVVGVSDSLEPLERALDEFRPHVVFNLLEEFQGSRAGSHLVLAYLELRGVAYTGCNPRGQMMAQDKALSKALLLHYGVQTPDFVVVPVGRKPPRKRLRFPLIVKSLHGDASEGLAQASVVRSPSKLAARVDFIHRHHGDALVEEYISGRELYCGVIGYRQLTAFPVWELRMTKLPTSALNIATQRVKWDLAYQDRVGVELGPARLPPALERRIQDMSKRAFSLLKMTGWGRMDYRLAEDGEPYFLEANPNGDIAHVEEFASSAKAAGLSYLELLHRLINIARRAAGQR
ncbi:hypothetical protein PPSIR1_41439 [Plesiocystis pacifica SIR-1]|uniref:ATP-grasp domain-containing protein n=1 Tax=Plesiocystis pacifica SIR-1 TaxID=391625 RepID=A6GDH6_9BACT|nr:hypothetical protein PPSIR1_41439 [Plesiocystis pacifica SIR-1]